MLEIKENRLIIGEMFLEEKNYIYLAPCKYYLST
jgi:hypothetical protein